MKKLLPAIVLLAAWLMTPGCSRMLSKPAPPSTPEPEEMTRDVTSVWSLTYSPDGAFLLSSHVFQWSRDQTCGNSSVAPAKFELWGLGACALGQPEGQLATFSAPEWRWRPNGGR